MKVVEVNEQSMPVKKEEPSREIPVKVDKSVSEVSSKQAELPRTGPVQEAGPVSEVSSKKDEPSSDVAVKDNKPAPVAPAKENKPALQRVFSKETLSTIRTTASDLTAVVNQEVSSIQSMLRTSEDNTETSSRQVPETPKQKSQNQNGQVNGASKPIGSCLACQPDYLGS